MIAERITVKETAKLLGCHPMAVSRMLQQRLLPFGVAYQNKAGTYSYLIYRADVIAYLKQRGES